MTCITEVLRTHRHEKSVWMLTPMRSSDEKPGTWASQCICTFKEVPSEYCCLCESAMRMTEVQAAQAGPADLLERPYDPALPDEP